ncbi:cysteine peptidase family C39 domain-containing protein [Parapedobacter tibetensis]|uniref:cysteine peptidase family C39 domain-containing protein n=1 Tax=Parapedobacter tibetensis TaxID=2972951 RepID=UPI00214D76AE|nr:cysteine peptidase family C39 domain-containing protein [Parapedobacter tibetensis]
MKINSIERNAAFTVRRACKIVNIKVTDTRLQETLLEHPHFPSMQSLKDTLTSFNVSNLAVRIDPILLQRITLPVIVYLNNNIGYVTVEKVENGFVEWFHNDLGAGRDHIADFSRKWNGVSLVIEPSALSGDTDYEKYKLEETNRRRKRYSLWIASLILFLLWLLESPATTNTLFNLLLFIKIIGSVASFKLVQISMDKYDSFWRKDKRLNFPSNSERILRSKMSKSIFGLHWAELCLLFFSGGLLSLLTSNLSNLPSRIDALQIFSYLALGLTAWILYVQSKLKGWSPLCVLVSGLLCAEFLILFKVIPTFSGDWKDTTQLILLFSIPTVIWVSFKGVLGSSSTAQGHYYTIKKMMYDPAYLRSLLAKKKELPPLFSKMNSVTIGVSEARTCITLVLSPICFMSRTAFFQTQELILANHGIRCEIFLAVSQNPESFDYTLASAILGTTSVPAKVALEDWYKQMPIKFEDWSKTLQFDKKLGLEQLIHHFRWFELSALRSELPIILMDGAELPMIYNASDIKRMLNVNLKG